MSLPKITSVMLNVTHSCNLRCRYCFVHQEPQTMTYQTAKDAVDFLVRNCGAGITPGINFFGGEPTLCWDSIIVPLTRYIRDELQTPFQLSMTSNGTLLNEDRIRFLKENGIGVLFSIDGAKETQDYNRPQADGSGSFDRLQAIIPVIAREFRTTFRMTAIPETCGHLFENIRFAEQSGFGNFFVIPNVFQTWDVAAWSTLEKEFGKYTDYYIQCYREGKAPILYSEFERAFSDIRQINSAITRDVCRENCRACHKCGLGANRFASIHPNGDIYGCQELTSNDGPDSPFWIGNIYTGVRDDRREALMEMFDHAEVGGNDCENCRMKRICDGGCVANNYMVTGSMSKPPEVYCRWKQLVLEDAIRAARALGDNEAFITRWRKSDGKK